MAVSGPSLNAPKCGRQELFGMLRRALGDTDVLYVADAFQVMAKVNELLAAGPNAWITFRAARS